MFRHILLNVLPLGIIYLAQDAAYAILAHVTLAFLGYADQSALAWGPNCSGSRSLVISI